MERVGKGCFCGNSIEHGLKYLFTPCGPGQVGNCKIGFLVKGALWSKLCKKMPRIGGLRN